MERQRLEYEKKTESDKRIKKAAAAEEAREEDGSAAVEGADRNSEKEAEEAEVESNEDETKIATKVEEHVAKKEKKELAEEEEEEEESNENKEDEAEGGTKVGQKMMIAQAFLGRTGSYASKRDAGLEQISNGVGNGAENMGRPALTNREKRTGLPIQNGPYSGAQHDNNQTAQQYRTQISVPTQSSFATGGGAETSNQKRKPREEGRCAQHQIRRQQGEGTARQAATGEGLVSGE